MRRAFVLLAVLGISLSAAVPAHAWNDDAVRHLGSWGGNPVCYTQLRINHYEPRHGHASLFNINPAQCYYLGMKVTIVKCDGSFSTSAETHRFYANTGQGLSNTYDFACGAAYIDSIRVRVASPDKWAPPQTGPDPFVLMYSRSGNCFLPDSQDPFHETDPCT